MRLTIDTTGKDFIVTKSPRPKLDQTGQQRVNKGTGGPLWATQLVVTDEDGGDIISVTTDGRPADLEVGDGVEVFELIAIPWNSAGRGSGVAYQATSIKIVE